MITLKEDGERFLIEDGGEGSPLPDGVPPDDVEKLLAAHRDLWLISTAGYHMIVKVPPVTKGDRYLAQISSTNKKGEHEQIGPASRVFASACIVWPAPEQVCAMIDRFPGIAGKIAGELLSIYMGEAEELAKKIKRA